MGYIYLDDQPDKIKNYPIELFVRMSAGIDREI